MSTTLTSKGQVTVPKPIRDALGLTPGATVEFVLNEAGDVTLRPAKTRKPKRPAPDRFDAARGTANVHWRTDDLMALLRGEP